jgi:hypothetical protein
MLVQSAIADSEKSSEVKEKKQTEEGESHEDFERLVQTIESHFQGQRVQPDA